MNYTKPFGLILIVLIADQILKIWVKTHMHLGEEIPVFGNWFYLHFIENNGMAFGLEWGGQKGKLFLSIFRLIAITAIGLYLVLLIKQQEKKGVILCIALIFAGAAGNMIDSAFYGRIFSASGFHYVAEAFPEAGGYNKLLQGKVVDMFYFPVINTNLPKWLPFFGSKHFLFFAPVFNIADSAITTGVLSLIVFHNKFFRNTSAKKETE